MSLNIPQQQIKLIQNIENLLNRPSDWKGTQKIIKETFLSFYDIITYQNTKLAELESNLKKSNFQNPLNIPTIDDIQILIEDKVSKADLTKILKANSMPNSEEIKTILKGKADIAYLDELAQTLQNQIEVSNRELLKKINLIPSIKDISKLSQQLSSKLNINDMNDILSSFSTKEELINSLRVKANKTEVEAQLKNKFDNADVKDLLSLIDTKASIEDLEKCYEILNSKLDISFVNKVKDLIHDKVNINEFEAYNKQAIEYRNIMNKKIEEIDSDLDSLILNIKTQFQNLNNVILNLDSAKEEKKNFEALKSALDKKLDEEVFTSTINQTKFDLNDQLNELKKQEQNNFKNYEEVFNSKIESEVVSINKNIERFRQEIKGQTESIKKIKSFSEGVNTGLNEQNKTLTTVCEQNTNRFEKIYSALKNKVDLEKQKQFEENLQKFYSDNLANKASYTDLDNIYKKLQLTVNDKINEFKSYFDNSDTNKLIHTLNTDKVAIKDLDAIFKDKLEPVVTSLNSKVELKEVMELQNSIKKVNHTILDLVEKKNFDKNKLDVQKAIDSVNEALTSKISINELEDKLFTKVENQDWNNQLQKIYSNLDNKIDNEQFEVIRKSQDDMNCKFELCNCLGRWLWKSGKLKNISMIPWEEQTVNTKPNNFFWEKDKSAIMIATNGIYQIWICVFGLTFGSSVKLIINGDCYGTKFFEEDKDKTNTINSFTSRSEGRNSKFLFLQSFVNVNQKSRLCFELENPVEGASAVMSIIQV